jgi:hypothetical protein
MLEQVELAEAVAAVAVEEALRATTPETQGLVALAGMGTLS